MACLYIDLEDTGYWNRPAEWGDMEATAPLRDTVNDYAAKRDRLREEVLGTDHPRMTSTTP